MGWFTQKVVGIDGCEAALNTLNTMFTVGDTVEYLGRDCMVTRVGVMVYGGMLPILAVDYSDNSGRIRCHEIRYDIAMKLKRK